MPVENAPSHKPQHGDLLSMKGKVSPSDSLNIAESEAHTLEGRGSTAAERKRALDIGAKMNEGTLPAFSLAPGKVLDPPPQAHSGQTGGDQPRTTNTKTFFTP